MGRPFQPASPVVENEDWKNCWETGFSGWHRPSWNPYLIRYFPQLGVPAGAQVLVPLCGKSRDMEWLQRRGYHVVGLELSGLAIEDFFRERGMSCTRTMQRGHNLWRGPGIDIWEGDIFDLPDELTEASVLYDRGALVALPIELRQKYVDKLRSLAPELKNGVLMGLYYDQVACDGPPWSLSAKDVQAVWGDGFEITTLDEDWEAREAARLRELELNFAHLTLRLERR